MAESTVNGVSVDPVINSYTQLQVIIISVNGTKWDVTANVMNITLIESISAATINGVISMMDDSGVVHAIPLIGQERVIITFVKDGTKRSLEFRLNRVHDTTKIRKDVSGLKFELVSEKEYLNSSKTFSRSFSGSTTDIISKIHEEYLNQKIQKIDNEDTGASSINLVLPYIKPYQAINKILEESYATNGSPLFLFESLNSVAKGPKIKSFNTMMSDDSKVTIGEKEIVNLGEGGSTTRGMHKDRTNIDNIKQSLAYDTLGLLSTGSYGSNVSVIDISNKTISNTIFDYTKSAETISPEHMTSKYTVNKLEMSDLSDAKHHVLSHNNNAYDNALNYQTIDPQSLLIRKSSSHPQTKSKESLITK